MTEEYIDKIKKDKETSKLIADKLILLNSKSLTTQAEIAKELTKINVVIAETIDQMGEEIADMDIEIEEKTNQINYLTNKIGITEVDFIKEYSKTNIEPINTDRKKRVWERMNRRNERHKQLML
jgi:uncharacterized coiled-coil protein SlyX